MGAGLNIACHGGQSYLPQTNDPELAAEIEALAVANGVTFTGSGIWDMSRIWAGVLTAGPCTDITSLHHRSLTDPEGQLLTLTRGSAFNRSPESFYERGLDKSPVLLAHKAIPELVLRSARLHRRRVDGDRRAGRLRRAGGDPVDPRGMLRGRRVRRGAHAPRGHDRGGRRRHGRRSSSACSCPATSSTWPGRCEGTPRNRMRVERLDSAEATAGNLFNRIPDIIAAPPGIVPVTELGPAPILGEPLAEERGVSAHPLRLSVDELLAQSREVAGVDLVDDEIVEPLTVLHRALNKERAQLDAEGARAFEREAPAPARQPPPHAARLPAPPGDRRAADHAARSSSWARRDRAPRSCRRSLAASGDFNFLTFWQSFNWASISGEPNEPIEAADRRGRGLLPLVRRTLARGEARPSVRGARARGGRAPERGVLRHPQLRRLRRGTRLRALARRAAARPSSSSSSATCMQYLQWQGLADADRPWLLKSPSYSSPRAGDPGGLPRRPVRHGAPLAARDAAVDVQARRPLPAGLRHLDARPDAPDGARRRQHGGPARHPPGAPGPPPAGPAVRGHRRRPARRWWNGSTPTPA